jgi:hypothetical protein
MKSDQVGSTLIELVINLRPPNFLSRAIEMPPYTRGAPKKRWTPKAQ